MKQDPGSGESILSLRNGGVQSTLPQSVHDTDQRCSRHFGTQDYSSTKVTSRRNYLPPVRSTVHTHAPVAYTCPAGHHDEEGSGASLSGGEAGGAGPV